MRDLAQRNPGHLPGNAAALAAASAESQTPHHHWMALAAELDALEAEDAAGRSALGMRATSARTSVSGTS